MFYVAVGVRTSCAGDWWVLSCPQSPKALLFSRVSFGRLPVGREGRDRCDALTDGFLWGKGTL